jgi:hypothetical protein
MIESRKSWAYKYVSIGVISCSMLTYEILLTRVCALRLFFHFTFLVISNCLLGIGASGLTFFCILYTVSLIVSYSILLVYPLWTEKPEGLGAVFAALLVFAGFNLVAALPFFCGGMVVGMLLSFNADRVNRLYATDLIGAGLGCLAFPLLLEQWGAGGVFVLVAMMAVATIVSTAPTEWKRIAITVGTLAAVAGVWLLPTLDTRFPVPSRGSIELATNIEIKTEQEGNYSAWSVNSRIDLIPQLAFIFGRGTKLDGLPPLPEAKLILQDSSAGTFIVNWSENLDGLEILRRTTYSAALSLKQNPRVFIIGLGGGNDAWAAKANGARFFKAAELNERIIEIHQSVLPHYSTALLEDPNFAFVVGEGRSVLMRESEYYDVIQMSGIDTATALQSGGYILAENYLYTIEALKLMYERLNQNGVLQITRMARDMEALRMVSTIHATLEILRGADLADSLMVLGTEDNLMTLLVKKGTFSESEVAQIERFAEENGIRRVYLPRRNLNGLVETFVLSEDKQRFVDAFPRDITPTTDDRPYFFNFSKWRNPFESRRYVLETPAVSQGNPFFILLHLLLSILLSGGLILLPLTRLGGLPRRGVWRYLVYFSGLGMGFIAIELSVIQKLTLFLGLPIYSITVTLFSILVFAGMGSLVLAGRFSTTAPQIWVVPLGLLGLLASFVLFAADFINALIGLPLPARIMMTILILTPISLLLGVPFAYGIRVLNERNPTIIPWAWGVNGCFSVIGSILTVVISMNLGFRTVLCMAGVIYLVAFWALRREIALSSR